MPKQIHPLRLWRFSHGVGLVKLSKRCRVSVSHLSQIETGKRQASKTAAAKIFNACALLSSPLVAPSTFEIMQFGRK